MYANGMVPLSVMVWIVGNIWLPAGTAARFAWAFEAAFQKYGVRLRFTPDRDGLGGWNGYRPRDAQIRYKQRYGNKAAAVGFSTHGGNVGGREIFAADIDNWAELGWARFAAVMRLAGLTVDYVTPREEWHVVDLNNPWMVPAFAGGSAPAGGGTTTGDDDLPYSEKDLKGIVQNAILDLGGNDGGRNILDSQNQTRLDIKALAAEVADVGGKVWRNPLVDPSTGREMPAKEFMRYAFDLQRTLILEMRALNVVGLSKLTDAQLKAYGDAVAAELLKRKS